MTSPAQERQYLEEALASILDLTGEEARGGVRVSWPEKVKEMFTDSDNQIYQIENKTVRLLSRITGLPEEKLSIAEAVELLMGMRVTTREDAIAFLKEEAKRLEPHELDPNNFRDETVDCCFLLQAVNILEKHA